MFGWIPTARRGAGGQHINKTDSAVRLTHIPTGIVVSSQQDRSQHKNRAIVWEMLRARLYERELKKREDAAQAEAGRKKPRSALAAKFARTSSSHTRW